MFLWQRLVSDLLRSSDSGGLGEGFGEGGYSVGEGVGSMGMGGGMLGSDIGALGDIGSRGFSTTTEGFGDRSGGGGRSSTGGRSGDSLLGNDLGSALGDIDSPRGFDSYSDNWGGTNWGGLDTAVSGGLQDAFGDVGPQGFSTTTSGYGGGGVAPGILGADLGLFGDVGGIGNVGNIGPATSFGFDNYQGSSWSELGNTGPQGFGMTAGWGGAAPFGGSTLGFGGAPDLGLTPAFGTGFGVSPSEISMGAPYPGAELDTGILSAGGLPGSRIGALGQSLTEQQRANVEMGYNPNVGVTREFAAGTTNQQIADAYANSSFARAAAQPDRPAVATLGPGQGFTERLSPTTPTNVAYADNEEEERALEVAMGMVPSTVPTPPDPSERPVYAGAPAPKAERTLAALDQIDAPQPAAPALVEVAAPTPRPADLTLAAAPTPAQAPQTGIMSVVNSPLTQTAVDVAGSLISPVYGGVNLASRALTGTGVAGQVANVAQGQGLRTDGGLMGLLSGQEAVAQDVSVAGGDYGYSAPREWFTPAEAPAVASAPSPSTGAPTTVAARPGTLDLANFRASNMPAYQMVETQSPAFARGAPVAPVPQAPAYYTAQGFPVFYSGILTQGPYRAFS